MNRVVRSTLLALLLGLAMVSSVWAQAVVQQSASRADAATLAFTSTTSAATITISPPAGQYFWLTGLEITNCAGAAAVVAAAVTTVTTTGIGGGTTPVWTLGSGTTAGACQPSPVNSGFALPLKSNAPGTNVTVVLPAFAANQTLRVSAYGYYSP